MSRAAGTVAWKRSHPPFRMRRKDFEQNGRWFSRVGVSGAPMNMTAERAGRMLADPLAYTDEVRLHQAMALLRREAPVQFVEAAGYKPFFAVTRHADIMAIERDSA